MASLLDTAGLAVLNLSKLKKNNCNQTPTATNRLKCFTIFKNIVHSFEPGETPSCQAPNYRQRY